MADIIAELRELADPWPAGSYVKEAINRAAKAAGLPYWRTFDLWYRKARRIEDYEREAVAAALDKKRKEAARNEFQELRFRLARLESMLAQGDPDFHRPAIDAVGDQIREMGGARGAVARPGYRPTIGGKIR